jgi:glycine/D-amino acid oxidase-like deaminating enzyme
VSLRNLIWEANNIPAVIFSMNQADGSPTILVVGGGLAGLFCALECVRNGFSKTVLESRAAIQSAGKRFQISTSHFHHTGLQLNQ